MKILVYGIVQGIGFRPTVARLAKKLGLNGYVMNRGSHVEIYVEKNEKRLIEELMKNLPDGAVVEGIIVKKEEPEVNYEGFVIVKSRDDSVDSLIPPDRAICENCLRELFDPNNRRYMYPFTNCTVCGARFSIIRSLPYDRENTTMRDFPMCEKCAMEFESINDRRYDAQTISCPECGPRYILYDSSGKVIEEENPIRKFAELIEEGYIGVAKSWGGMHLICRMDMVNEFRRWYGRKQKPFAVMFRDIETIKKYAYVDENEEKVLISKEHPIVLLRKKDSVPEGIAPGLPTIGAYLPYSAMHYIFFHFSSLDGVIMTSANRQGVPMITRNEDVFVLNADYYLLHNREIENRVDDSVVRVIDGHTLIIRRSRGYVPLPVYVDHRKKIISLGGQLNVSASISVAGKIYATQYIGNVENYETLEFLEQAIRKFMRLFRMNAPELIAVDKNPRYTSRILAKKLAEEYKVPIVNVQHHHAHAVSLLLDSHIDEGVILTLDGTGYGDDGNSWGGEIIEDWISGYRRVGHIEYIPLIGGDKAVIEPERIVFAIAKMLGRDYPIKNGEVLEKMMKKCVKTSSLGRVLDAIATYLNICKIRTYDGEPAMKLETYLMIGNKKYDFDVYEESGVIKILPAFEHLFTMKIKGERDKADIAYSLIYDILKVFVDIAYSHGKVIGISGGISYDEPIVKILKQLTGGEIIMHKKIPPGDNGISYGQTLAASLYE